ncbi:hypothetical protein AVEN_81489-1 [Araneus ventricosus]|uniref:Uncharacterized protein n=1 Tax=Araneus ventricosus TaxID=182803 RepID=A0A4Y2E4H7_ARAVE|nr:hypothetical protein AVEN_81489-1 [Araneus ventricosus]
MGNFISHNLCNLKIERKPKLGELLPIITNNFTKLYSHTVCSDSIPINLACYSLAHLTALQSTSSSDPYENYKKCSSLHRHQSAFRINYHRQPSNLNDSPMRMSQGL